MVELGPHAAFIVMAYLAAIVIVSALLLWIVRDRRKLKRELAEMEAQGIGRRSDPPRGTP